VISVKNNERSRRLAETNLEYPGLSNLPSHLEFDKNTLTGKVNGVIEREWIALSINELLIVEYYSRKV
jgi:small subunit ribosomal protein S4